MPRPSELLAGLMLLACIVVIAGGSLIVAPFRARRRC